MEEFVYWRHPTLPRIKVEEVTEGEDYSGPAWLDAAKQIYCENGREEYRETGHFKNGAPFLYGYAGRISVTHCPGFLAVATLPATPEVELGVYSDRAALGLDAERRDRDQVVRLRDRVLSPEELAMIPADDVEANILGWTIKEACYKAALEPGLDFRTRIRIDRMPKIGPAVPVYDAKEFDYDGSGRGFHEGYYGKATVLLPDGTERPLNLYSYLSDDVIVTLAYSPKCARFGAEG